MDPTLSAVLALKTTTGGAWGGAMLGFVYCLGVGPIGMNWVSSTLSCFRRHIRTFNLVGGALLILVGVVMITT